MFICPAGKLQVNIDLDETAAYQAESSKLNKNLQETRDKHDKAVAAFTAAEQQQAKLNKVLTAATAEYEGALAALNTAKQQQAQLDKDLTAATAGYEGALAALNAAQQQQEAIAKEVKRLAALCNKYHLRAKRLELWRACCEIIHDNTQAAAPGSLQPAAIARILAALRDATLKILGNKMVDNPHYIFQPTTAT
jgi:chromosome segregation ATPase